MCTKTEFLSSRKCRKIAEIFIFKCAIGTFDKNKAIAKEKWRQNTKNSTIQGNRSLYTCTFWSLQKNGKLNRKRRITSCIYHIFDSFFFCLAAWIWTKLRAKKGFSRCYTSWATRTWSKVGWLSYHILFEGVPPT